MALHTYIPQDRLRALSRGETLPDRTNGAALFADISGFTPLTEGMRDSLGPRRGAEELSKQLGTVYTALIFEVEKYSSSVIDFAGDAITCWFDDANRDAPPRAVTCAFGLQAAMQSFSAIALPNGTTIALTLKVAVASGPERRFMLGDPTIHYIDALAGATVSRTSTAEHLATKGDVLVDEATANALGEKLSIAEWREEHESQERFAVVLNFSNELSDLVLPTTTRPPAANKLRVWLHGAVYEREQAGDESFLTEFRPCVALFMRFPGIDYDSDAAEKQLDMFLRQGQAIVEHYEGTFLQITIGDKGSYAYINFGALSVHEDDARRAVNESLELARTLGVVTQELRSHTLLGIATSDLDEAERLYTEVHTRAVEVGNRERALTALVNLGWVAGARNEHTKQRDYTLPALAIAREIGAQGTLALCLFNLADTNIVPGEHTAARAGLREGLALAMRLGALPRVITALIVSGDLACAEGQVERALALWGLARNHPAWSSGDQESLDHSFTLWKIDPTVAEAGMKKGAELDWDETVKELLK